MHEGGRRHLVQVLGTLAHRKAERDEDIRIVKAAEAEGVVVAEAHKIKEVLKHVRGAGQAVVGDATSQDPPYQHMPHTRPGLHIEDVSVTRLGGPQDECTGRGLVQVRIGVKPREGRVAVPRLLLNDDVAGKARGVVDGQFLTRELTETMEGSGKRTSLSCSSWRRLRSFS